MELRPLILGNVIKVGYEEPTPIQRRAYPVLAAKRDFMACAQTGSGKSVRNSYLNPLTRMAEEYPSTIWHVNGSYFPRLFFRFV